MSKTEPINLDLIIEAYSAWEEATRRRIERGGAVIPVAYSDAPRHVATLIAEVRRLQAIEAAAREYFDVQYRYRNGFADPDPDYHLESNAAYDALMDAMKEGRDGL